MSPWKNPVIHSALSAKEWHETFLKMIASTALISLMISFSFVILYVLLGLLHSFHLFQGLIYSLCFISLSILILQCLRSMYRIYYEPLLKNCRQNYQKIIFICCSFAQALIIVVSFLFSTYKTLTDLKFLQ